MKLNLRIFKALFKKDFKNCFVNKNVLLMLFLPVMFCIVYQMMFQDIQDLPTSFITIFSVVLVLSVIPLNILSNMVAEEKEKHTMRSLMLANVSSTDFLLSKVAVSLVLVLIDSLIIFFICHQDIALLGYFIGILLLAATGIFFFGAIVGILAKDQMNAGTISSPLMILLMLPSMLSEFNSLFETVSLAFPTTSFQTLYSAVSSQQSLLSQNCFIAFVVCIIWIVIGLIIFSVVYKKRGLDD